MASRSTSLSSQCAQLSEIVQRVRDGRLQTNTGTVSTLDDAVAAFKHDKRRGKTIIRAGDERSHLQRLQIPTPCGQIPLCSE